MQLRIFQECREAEGWQPVRIHSSSKKNKVYTVLCNPWGATNENICECESYLFRGSCRHQQEAQQHLCTWRDNGEADSTIQTPTQASSMICPMCGGPTKYQVESYE